MEFIDLFNSAEPDIQKHVLGILARHDQSLRTQSAHDQLEKHGMMTFPLAEAKVAIRTMRLVKGLEQQELAELLNVSPGSISNYEGGSRKPSVNVIARIAEALGMDVHLVFKERDA